VKKRVVLTTIGALLAIGLTCVLMLVLPIAWDMAANSLRLEQYRAAFRRVEHPRGSVLIDTQREVGLLTGSSNHCDFFVGELRRSSGPPADVIAFYTGKTLEPDGTGRLRLAFVQDGEFTEDARLVLPYGLDTLSAWSVPLGEDTDGLYVVYFFRTGLSRGWDLRCG
jgi:hypothetical protein